MPRPSRHLALVFLAAVWLALVATSFQYVGHFFFHYIFVSIRWLQYLLILVSLYTAALLLLSLRRRAGPGPTVRRPFVSILVPVKDEHRVIAATLRSLATLDYHARGRRRFEIIVIDDRSTDDTPRILEALQPQLRLRIVRTPEGSIGKAAALNVGLRHARGDLLAVFDADSRVAPDFLQQLVGRLGPGTGAVQATRLAYNPGQNLLTRMQDDEYRIHMAFMQGRVAGGGFVSLSGNGLIVRRSALQAVGGWNEDALTEDIDLSIRLWLADRPVVYCAEAVVWEEAVPSLPALLRQRQRWFEGAMRCLAEHLPAILTGRTRLRVRADMLFFLAGSLVTTLALLTTYVYGLLRLGGIVVLFLQVPGEVMVAVSGLVTAGLVAVAGDQRGWQPAAALGTFARFTLFSMHSILVNPLAMARYVRNAATCRLDWAKTPHVGEEPGSAYIKVS